MCGHAAECARMRPSTSTIRTGLPSQSTKRERLPGDARRGHPARERGAAMHHHRLVLVPEARVQSDEGHAHRIDGFVRHTGNVELHPDLRVRGARRRQTGPDLRAATGTVDGARHIAALGALHQQLEPDLSARLDGLETHARTPAPGPGVVALDLREAGAMEPGKVLPIEHVLPDTIERGVHRPPVRRHAPRSLAVHPNLSSGGSPTGTA
jgi:hypothetical protein